MNTVWQDTINLEVYNKNGEFVERLDFIREGSLAYMEDDSMSFLSVGEALNNIKMLELLSKKSKKSTDFNDSVKNPQKKKTLTFNSKDRNIELKLIANSIDYNLDTGDIEHDIRIIMPKVELLKHQKFELGAGEVHTPEYVFAILPYNEEGDLFQMEFIKRKKGE